MDREPLITVGKCIARFRKMKNLTQSDLGKMIGVNQAVISGWEIGRYDPGVENIILLSSALGVAPNDLLGYRPPGAVQNVVMPDDSMEPQIHRGDVLTVQTDVEPTDGDIVAVDTSKGKNLIRRLFHFGAQVVLLSVNPSIPPIGVHYADIKGKVTDIHRKL